MSRRAPNIATIAPGAGFLPTFAKALLNGELFPSFSYQPDHPHRFAKARIYVPTRRAARALRSEFADQIGRGSVILPEIRPLGDHDEELDFFKPTIGGDLDQLEPISKIQSTLILGELIFAWKNALPKIFSRQLKSVPLVAPANPADALWLAQELLGLIETAESEEKTLTLIDQIDAADHAEWWQLTLEFLKIAREFWPARLSELGKQSQAKYQISALDRQTEYLNHEGFSGPVIVAGSTGSLPATARLISLVSKLENGLVVLPGLDQKMTAEQWQSIYEKADIKSGIVESDHLASIVIQGHPQYGLARLLSRMEMGVSDIGHIKELGQITPELDKRQSIVSKAMLPVVHTDAWSDEGEFSEQEEQSAMAGVTLIEADNEREEATAIAASIRLALEPGDVEKPNVALVTPDRNLARKVSIELTRYGIDADDSGGLPLLQTQLGTLVSLLVEILLKQPDKAAFASLLKHPLALFGLSQEQSLQAASIIERIILRGKKTPLKTKTIRAEIEQCFEELAEARHVPMWRKYLSDDDKEIALQLASKIEQAFAPLLADQMDDEVEPGKLKLPPAEWAKRTILVLEQITCSEDNTYDVWDSEAGIQLVNTLDEIRSCPSSIEVSGHDWADMLEPLLGGQVVKPKAGKHPRVMIWGALEARLQSVDTLIMAGLNEGTWPSVSSNDPFLSRTMKSEIGLEPPERRLGLSAHDFQMGMGTKNVILSRALKSDGAPSVASRWVQRLLTLMSEQTAIDIRARGKKLVSYTKPSKSDNLAKSAQRPEPKPPEKYQPISYSFSEVSLLRRDPYAIYAKRILRLDRLEDFASEPDLRERGTLYHAIIERFYENELSHEPEDAYRQLVSITNSEFDMSELPTEISFVWKHRFMQVAQSLIDWEYARAPEVRSRRVELSARCNLPGDREIKLTGRADRIDLMVDGNVEILDFKTGTSPSAKEARSLLDPQLPLEAYAMEKGGFGDFGPYGVNSLKYIRLKPSDNLIVDQVEEKPTTKQPEPLTPSQIGEKAAEELSRLLAALGDNKVGFLSRAIPKIERDYSGDYDHLARVSEWSVADTDDGGDDV